MTDFRLTDETYERIMNLLDDEMKRGLGAQSHQMSTVRMFPTYVRSVPDGTGGQDQPAQLASKVISNTGGAYAIRCAVSPRLSCSDTFTIAVHFRRKGTFFITENVTVVEVFFCNSV